MTKQQDGIKERTYDFALRIIKLSKSIPTTREGNILAKQVMRSGTSIGANVEEATGAFSKDDFTYKMNIALKEARETHYWLRLIRDSEFFLQNA
jgi:four helix bundle protein